MIAMVREWLQIRLSRPTGALLRLVVASATAAFVVGLTARLPWLAGREAWRWQDLYQALIGSARWLKGSPLGKQQLSSRSRVGAGEGVEAKSKATPQCMRFVEWLLANGIDVVVFDMDMTMGSGHCGPGLAIAKVGDYIAGASPDFVEAALVLSRMPGIRLAVATNSDPAEYDLEGQSRDTHILGPDLARALIQHHCGSDVLARFEIMIGHDPDLHKDMTPLLGKSVHMRKIAEHYGSKFERMILIDDSPSRLENVDGWQGILVRNPKVGFRFEDCLERTDIKKP